VTRLRASPVVLKKKRIWLSLTADKNIYTKRRASLRYAITRSREPLNFLPKRVYLCKFDQRHMKKHWSLLRGKC
jgi:hypothetical protein